MWLLVGTSAAADECGLSHLGLRLWLLDGTPTAADAGGWRVGLSHLAVGGDFSSSWRGRLAREGWRIGLTHVAVGGDSNSGWRGWADASWLTRVG